MNKKSEGAIPYLSEINDNIKKLTWYIMGLVTGFGLTVGFVI